MVRLQWVTFSAVALILFLASIPMPVRSADLDLPDESAWPREITVPEATILIYQPQVENLEGNHLDSRFAASVQTPKMAEPVFGAVWTKARVETDRDARIVRLVSLETVRSRFPNATPEQEAAFAAILKKYVPAWDLPLSLDRLLASLEVIEQRRVVEGQLENQPPAIIYVDRPAMLVMLDGEPILNPIENSNLMAVVNTPFPMVFNKADKSYYLMGNDTWYRATAVADKWEEIAEPPQAVMQVRPETPDTEDPSEIGSDLQIIGATEPTELIATDGPPRLTPFPGNDLMFVENTTSDILYEVETGHYFLLISGRWYQAKQMTGPWSHVLPDRLPTSFARIPADSEKAELLASVPGTVEAREAVLDAQVPQTAVVNRSEATLTVVYDGEPKFERIKGTTIDYAVNTATSVIRVEGTYYAVDNGVWYVSAKPKGAWAVADRVPASVQDIPPSSPIYNIKYVYVYDATPEVVYVGYTPGYTGCYVHHGVVVYGTGYRYHPWHHHYYYPRPVTWGYSVRYSSYYGWSFGVAFSNGPFTFYFGHGWGSPYYHGWWGPPRYRPPYYRPPHHRPPPHRPPGDRPPKPTHPIAKPPGDRPPGGGPVQLPSDGNLYDRLPGRENGDLTRPATREVKGTRPAGQPASLPNNVYTDRDGNVYRQTGSGWEQRQGNQWTRPDGDNAPGSATRPATQPSGPAVQPAQPPSQRPTAQPAQQPGRQPTGGSSWDRSQRNLQRDANSRSRGQQRTQQYQRSRQSQSSRGGGARRGGGGRRN
jgi:hypothetical protein